jgi:hypothetical protein
VVIPLEERANPVREVIVLTPSDKVTLMEAKAAWGAFTMTNKNKNDIITLRIYPS